jgi:hypothetical protein
MNDAPPPAGSDAKKKATAATFGLVSEKSGKFSIKSVDKPSLTVTAQFNPTAFELKKEVPWSPPGDAGGANGGTKQGASGVEMQFTGAKGRSFQIDLLFDDVDKDRPGKCMENLAVLEEMATVIDPKSKEENKRRPHWCVATLGEALPAIRCVITSLTTKYEIFNPQGKPLRIRVSLGLAEATSVSIKDHNPKPKPPAPAGGGGGSGGGTSTPGAGA